jgi:hypothetical protein
MDTSEFSGISRGKSSNGPGESWGEGTRWCTGGGDAGEGLGAGEGCGWGCGEGCGWGRDNGSGIGFDFGNGSY